MKKIILSAICCVLCVCIIPSVWCPVKNNAYAEDLTTAKSACVIDYYSGELLFERNKDDRLQVASIVKLMTLLLTYEEIESGRLTLETEITTSENAAGMGGSQVFVDPYVTYVTEKLIQSIVMSSANDASVAMAEHISGSEQSFVSKMNEKAKALGMNNTKYANCTGLPAPEQYSTAYDIAILLREVINHKIAFKFSTIWMDEFVHPSGRKTELVNTNKLIRYYQGCDIGKTGYTDEAGHCLCASSEKNNMRLISVVLGAKDSQTRFNESMALFNFGFANFENKQIVNDKTSAGKITVKKGKIENIDVFAEKSFYAINKKGDKSTYETLIEIDKSIVAPAKKGSRVGTLTVVKNGEVKEEIALILNEDLESLTFGDGLKKIAEKW